MLVWGTGLIINYYSRQTAPTFYYSWLRVTTPFLSATIVIMNKPMTDKEFIAQIIYLDCTAFYEGQSDCVIVAELYRRFQLHAGYIQECLKGTGHPDEKSSLTTSVPHTEVELF